MTTVLPLARKWLILLAWCWSVAPPIEAAADEATSVTVALASGREFTGQLDPRSDEGTLWLRFGRGTAHVLRPIQWDQVFDAQLAGEDMSSQQLREHVIQLERILARPKDTSAVAPLPEPRGAPSPPRAAEVGSPATVSGSDGASPRARPARPRATSMIADAWVANWDGDVENDGLVVSIAPVDADGREVAASGRLDVYLIGPRLRRFSEAPQSRGFKFDRLGHWVRAVRASDFRNGGAAYRLAFQAIHPEFDNRLGSHALVSVRLTVPGSGTFQRTVEYLRVQPFSPLRDYQQLRTGGRWLAVERTGRGKRAYPQP
jgi:hypothetical protein